MESEGIIVRLFASLLRRVEAKTMLDDPTWYQIRTQTSSYTGKIAFQNDKFLKVALLMSKLKVVKILKENILEIKIHK